VIIRGIERRRIIDNDTDRNDFVSSMGALAAKTDTKIYAWALMTNHAHILLRSSSFGLSGYMRRLLTGYAIRYNRRHKRFGHLFQNRYKSIANLKRMRSFDERLEQASAYINDVCRGVSQQTFDT